jgi:hypothetical protein
MQWRTMRQTNEKKPKMKMITKKMTTYFIIAVLLIFSIPCNAQQKIKNEKLEGNWCLNFQHNEFGTARILIYFETDGDKFEAYSRKNADKDILGAGISRLLRTFSKNFKNGVLARIVEGTHKIENDTLKLSGKISSFIGTLGHFNGYIIENDLFSLITNDEGVQIGTITGTKKTIHSPLEDYSDLFKASLRLTEDKIFNKNVMKTKKWNKFERNIIKNSAKVQDDLEMIVVGLVYYQLKSPISHYAIFPSAEQENDIIISDNSNNVFLEENSPQTAYLKITSFGGTAAEMDSVFRIIIQNDYKNLIVDLRYNPGGDFEAGMAFASNVVESPFYGGVFLTQKWFNQYNKPPTVESYPNLPHFTEENFDLIAGGMHNIEGMCLKIVPKPEVYKGNIYILTTQRTSSACETIVYGLKQHKRATIIGEKTAGALLAGESFELDKGFSISIPTADYYTSDGFRIEGKGVKPDIKVKRKKILDYMDKKLIK